MRLDKYLADMGIGTRSEVKNLIRKGRVMVEGSVCKQPETAVSEETVVTCNGVLVSYQKYFYYMLYKPAGVVSAREDSRDKTVLDLLRESGCNCPVFSELSPVGRLDKDTEGLLLITNDGAMIHELLAPGKHVAKTYFARIAGIMTPDDVDSFQKGILLHAEKKNEKPEFYTLPAILDIVSVSEGESEVYITIEEGRYHQIKRMVHALGKEVRYLKRVSMGDIRLDDRLAPGEWRELTEEEKEKLV